MFSGIVQELGHVVDRDAARLRIATRELRAGLRAGESIAVNGACLTVVRLEEDGFAADVMPETSRRTTLGACRAGDRVNLERSLALQDLVGGHLVAGHVDGVGRVSGLRDEGNARRATIDAPSAVLELVAAKGCIAVDGISLTVGDVLPLGFTVSLIPHTLRSTTAGTWTLGSAVNLEADLVARYLQRLMTAGLRAQPMVA